MAGERLSWFSPCRACANGRFSPQAFQIILAFGWRQEDQDFKVILCYTESSRSAWTVLRPCQGRVGREKRKQEGGGGGGGEGGNKHTWSTRHTCRTHTAPFLPRALTRTRTNRASLRLRKASLTVTLAKMPKLSSHR